MKWKLFRLHNSFLSQIYFLSGLCKGADVVFFGPVLLLHYEWCSPNFSSTEIWSLRKYLLYYHAVNLTSGANYFTCVVVRIYMQWIYALTVYSDHYFKKSVIACIWFKRKAQRETYRSWFVERTVMAITQVSCQNIW